MQKVENAGNTAGLCAVFMCDAGIQERLTCPDVLFQIAGGAWNKQFLCLVLMAVTLAQLLSGVKKLVCPEGDGLSAALQCEA